MILASHYIEKHEFPCEDRYLKKWMINWYGLNETTFFKDNLMDKFDYEYDGRMLVVKQV